MFSFRMLIMGLFVVLGPLAAQGAPLRDAGRLLLVKQGRPAAAIVLAAAPTENARIAAGELQHYLEKMTGARLPILADNQAPSGPLVLVGRSRLTDAISQLQIPNGRTKDLKEEGFLLRTVGERLVLAGNDTEPYLGTRYAVIALLHRLGVRWFLPGEFGEVVPKRGTVAVGPVSVIERPSFPFRTFWEHGRGTMNQEREEWQVHNLMNPRMASWVGVPGDGSLFNFLPHEEFKAHPDWFALRRDGSRDDHMVCMTSPGMIAWFIERLKQEAKAGKRFVAFAPEDGAPRCYCERCMRLASAFDGYGSNDRDPWPESSTSQEWFYFINKVLDGVNQKYPDFRIATNGYSNRELAPNLPGFNAHRNLVIMFANICACTLHAYDDPHCWQMRRQGQMIRQWTRLCDKTWIYNYNYTMLVNKGTLTPMVHRVRRNLPLLKQWGVYGFDDQDECDWSMSGLATRLVRARLEWDVHADVEAILTDFYARWFGQAARPMRAYYDALERAFEETEAHGHEDVVLPHIYTPRLMASLRARMHEAELAARTNTEKLHVRLERLIYDHLREYVALEQAKQACRYREAVAHTKRMMALKDEMNKITPFMGWHPYPVYYTDWEQERMEGLLARTEGPQGALVAVLPAEARFRLDPEDDGRYAGWQAPDLDDSKWATIRTTTGWEQQGFQDQEGHPRRGVAWYRLNVEVPASTKGKRVRLCGPAAVSEVWVWVNGRYIGHRPYMIPWTRPQAFDFEVTPALRPGARNQITIRVLSNFEVFGASGLYERMFLYAAPPAPSVSSRMQALFAVLGTIPVTRLLGKW
ncbi:MAG TPA: DUF4838 domain-containing protein [Chthonomonadaceae bacterium]|nr:DUF4838 domain-containing protein [Chthonomonadaceae bacterium]